MQHIWLPILVVVIVILITEFHIEITIIDRAPAEGDKKLKKSNGK